LSDLNTRLVEAKTDIAQKKARLDLINTVEGKGREETCRMSLISAMPAPFPPSGSK